MTLKTVFAGLMASTLLVGGASAATPENMKVDKLEAIPATTITAEAKKLPEGTVTMEKIEIDMEKLPEGTIAMEKIDIESDAMELTVSASIDPEEFEIIENEDGSTTLKNRKTGEIIEIAKVDTIEAAATLVPSQPAE